ncbi:MAG: hypothetical protein HY298_15570 [Verrucomicrobia bacterium]|nr:hypothetical protein [Verrucomicrobiota bacterium]
MKSLLRIVGIGLVGSSSLGVFNARADLEVSASVNIHAQADFYAPLSSHGAWIEVGSYGRCWRPTGVAVEWRPYCYGHWVWTDCGWYWASDEPWGWACYHYGSWVYDPVQAWIWVPGIEWGPAWVSWRVGGGYIGWAPLPPPHVSVSVALGAPAFVFVETARFHDPIRPSSVVVNNTTIINKTTVINNIKHETRTVGGGRQKVVVNEGPGLAVVQKATGKQVKTVPIQEAARQSPAPPEVTRGKNEPKSNAKPSVAPSEQPKSAPERKAVPGKKSEPPAKRTAPDAAKKPDKEKPSVAPSEEPKLGPERKSPPSEKRAQPEKPTRPNIDKNRPPGKEDIAPEPKRRLTPAQPPEKPARPPEGKGEGKNPGKEDKGPEKDKP